MKLLFSLQTLLSPLRAPPKIQFGVQANLFDSGLRQEKATLVSTKADSPSLPEFKNGLLSAQKQLLEPPSIIGVLLGKVKGKSMSNWGYRIGNPYFRRKQKAWRHFDWGSSLELPT